jgi:hypothetical protein
VTTEVFTIVLFCAFFADYLIQYFRSGHWQRLNNNYTNNNNINTSDEPDTYPDQSDDTAAATLGTVASATRLKLFFAFMALAVVLTLVRCAYRLAELHEGYGGELVRDEGLFIGLEGV